MPSRPTTTPPRNSARLTGLTFLAVLGSIFLTGVAIVPVVIKAMEKRYLALQADVNARQAKSLARFAESRLGEGVDPVEVRAEIQALLAGADADRGYSCVIDRPVADFICHPMAAAIGMPVAGKGAVFSELGASDHQPWEDAIRLGSIGAGLLSYADGGREIVHMQGVSGTDGTITTHENTARVQGELAGLRKRMVLGSLLLGIVLAIPSSFAARAVGRRHERRIEAEQRRSDRLLLNILPPPIAERLKAEEQIIADRHPSVTVLFADIVGFTPMAANTSAEDLVTWLNELFSRFDDICAKYQLEKIKTIGDSYMLCGGIDGDPRDAARRVVLAGIEMSQSLAGHSQMQLRVGIHSGEVVAGVIGKKKFTYDLWGDVVNTASRLESAGVANRVQLSGATAELVGDSITLEARGEIEMKGIGKIPVWLASSPRAARQGATNARKRHRTPASQRRPVAIISS